MAKLSKLVSISVLILAACHGKKDSTLSNKDIDASIPKVDPKLCDTNGKNVVTYDLNHDNKPDVWRLYKTEDEGGTKVEFMTCKQVDFDHDGRKDWVVAYNRKGVPLYEKADFDYDGKWDVKEVYDSAGQLTSVRRDRNGDGQPDLWEQYKDGVLLAILYDDDFDGKVDRREEIPGARPKVEMPTTMDNTATGALDAAKPPATPAKPATTPAKPAAKPAPKK